MRIVPFATMALLAWCAIPGASVAAEPPGAGLRNSDRIEVSSARRKAKRTAQRTEGSLAQKEAWVGYDNDWAGNPYLYYRVGSDSPFGPGRGLRGRH